MVQQNHDALKSEVPEIDALVGLNDIERIAEACSLEAGARFEASRGIARYLYSHDSPRILATPGHSAYLKISEGCDTPAPSAPSVVPGAEVMTDRLDRPRARALAGAGTVEINLIARDTTN
jgi:ribosomal protein S12 methylthiotransferase